MQRDQGSVLDILQAAQNIQMFVGGLDREGFKGSKKDQSAALWELTIIGEATRRLSQEFRANHPDIPWQAIAGMRNKLVHGLIKLILSRSGKLFRMILCR